MPEIIIISHPTNVSCPLSTSCRKGSDKALLQAGRVGSLPDFKYLSISVICLQMEACVFSYLSHSVIIFSWKEKKKTQLMIAQFTLEDSSFSLIYSFFFV